MARAASRRTALTYNSYLELGTLLDCQRLESAKAGKPAHDEMLFIVTHQTYELWFKQILHELDAVLTIMGQPVVPERELSQVLRYLERTGAIQKVLLEQIGVLETMTPLDFLDFRDLLAPSSGFQSVQFRHIENKLGLKRTQRLTYNAMPYESALPSASQRQVRATESDSNLFALLEQWLARMPFLRFREYDFWHAYSQNVQAMLAKDRAAIEHNALLSAEAKAIQLRELDKTAESFGTVFDAERYQALVDAGQRRLSYAAFVSALMIHLYRDEPIFHTPFRILTEIVAIDESLTLWRYRHALMVNRMIGSKIGTGGSAGQDYLKRTVEAHRIFTDYFDLSTYLVPRSMLPPLPEELQRQLGFHWRGA
ncbi:MAG TPA: tryptophan 2,3-dioxygenase family protein [Burkholderiales bacterium]|nr:tryptophan 2,3-dioxygenase family protein [Burkholderiales bacterium]